MTVRHSVDRRTFLKSAAVMSTGGAWLGSALASCGSPSGATNTGDRSLQQARQEGEVVVYTSATTDFMNGLAQRFQADVPGIKVNTLFAPSASILSRLMSERSAGKRTCDVYIAWWDTSSQLVNHGYSLSYAPPNASAYKLRDSRSRWIALGAYANVIGYNKQHVRSTDVPTSYMDLVAAKYKGKIGLCDPRIGGGAYSLYYGIWKLYGVDYFTKAGKNAPFIQQQFAGLINAVGAGQIDMSLAEASNWQLAQQQGAPIGTAYPKEGSTLNYWVETIMNNAPHPNASKEFVKWLTSPKGQSAIGDVPEAIYPLLPGTTTPKGLPKLSKLKIIPVNFSQYAAEQTQVTQSIAGALGLS